MHVLDETQEIESRVTDGLFESLSCTLIRGEANGIFFDSVDSEKSLFRC